MFLGKIFYPVSTSLHPGVYKGTGDGIASHPGGESRNTASRFMLQKAAMHSLFETSV